MNRLMDAFTSGRMGIEGLFISGEGENLVEMAGLAGFSYVVLDGEHGSVWANLPSHIRAARLHQLGIVVRVPRGRVDAMAQALDWGADIILAPGASGAAEVQEAVSAVHYPPEGQRGLAFSIPAAQYGWEGPAYLERARRAPRLWVQVETREALEAVEEWAQWPGIDALFVGPTDLSMELGEEGRLGPRTAAAVTRVGEACRQAGRPWGTFTPASEDRSRWVHQGANLVATAVPLLLRQGVERWRGDSPHA